MPSIRSPKDLRSLSLSQREALAEDLRQNILSVCMENGGHLGASLGAVELAIALHTVFHSPEEPILWDVGHQAYAHKLLTGRWDRFDTLRKKGGIGGFLIRSESEHDVFGAGHSSTAASAALAMAWARGNRRENTWTVAVVGDGGLTAGLTFEALNQVQGLADSLGPFLLVINDNQMSISPNVGGISSILSSGRGREYFELLGFDFVGPLDGHDLAGLTATLEGLRGHQRPIALHVLTQKGRGYLPAEESPAAYHGINPLATRQRPGGTPPQLGAKSPQKAVRTFSQVFGESIEKLAEKDLRILAITAAMPEGTGLTGFSEKYPERFFDVGIAEQHAVTFAAGLATQGKIPIVAIYSTFLQRAIDQIIHDVALQGLGVIFCLDRAGVVGADGPTHHGVFDLAYLSMIPGMRILAPTCLEELSDSLCHAVGSAPQGPIAIRYPRGVGVENFAAPLRSGGSRWLREVPTPEVILLALGSAAVRAEAAAARLGDRANLSVIGTRSCKPLDSELLSYLQANPKAQIMSVEDAVRSGGFGEALERASGRPVHILAYPDRFLEHGTIAELEQEAGVAVENIFQDIQELLSHVKGPGSDGRR